ncbi:MAG: hypothetical protein IJB34_08270 [Clostridia bacterium]|nr:hypothetical protein [Clostridia bacterium]
MRYFSVFKTDAEILRAINDIHLKGRWYDLDCTYSKGVFWKSLPQPRYKSDLYPQYDDVMQIDATTMDGIEDNRFESIVFDPPFLFRGRKAENRDKMSMRFSYFKSYEDLMRMYSKSMEQFMRVLKVRGYLLFKCQDMSEHRFYCTHKDIINYAEKIGFVLRDIVIKVSSNKLQRDAKQQNCVAKTHSYWLVFKKAI